MGVLLSATCKSCDHGKNIESPVEEISPMCVNAQKTGVTNDILFIVSISPYLYVVEM